MRRADTSAAIDSSQSMVAASGLKAMIPVGRPFLDYVLSALRQAGYTDACLVIGPEHGCVREYYTQCHLRHLQLHFAVQPDPRGTADALLAAESFVGADDFVVLNSDNYYPVKVLADLATMPGAGAVMFEREGLIANSNIPPDRVSKFAYATIDSIGYLLDLVEKPESESISTEHQLISMNCWRFSPEIFRYCRSVPMSERGEFELPQAVRLAVKSGMRLKITASAEGVLDLSTRSDIAKVASRLQTVSVDL